MKLSASREQILAPLQSVIGVVERRQTMPVLSNVLFAARNNRISITGTDLEVELVASGEAQVQQPGDVTVPGRKLLDIFRALPEKTSVTVATDGERLSIKAGRSRFTLSTLPALTASIRGRLFPAALRLASAATITTIQIEPARLMALRSSFMTTTTATARRCSASRISRDRTRRRWPATAGSWRTASRSRSGCDGCP